MDQFGPLPLTLAAREARLCGGEVLNIEGKSADGFNYTLSFEGERFLLRQGIRCIRSARSSLRCLPCSAVWERFVDLTTSEDANGGTRWVSVVRCANRLS